jgi:hypothetical protein
MAELHAGLGASGNRVSSLTSQRGTGPLTHHITFHMNSFILHGSKIVSRVRGSVTNSNGFWIE